jgi:serine/threonine-protein kinase
VPNVVDQNEADANSIITSVDNLTVGNVTYQYSATIAIGRVVSQNPVAGTVVPTGSLIDLVVSAAIVPDVGGQTLADANSNIIAASLSLGTVTYEYSETVTPGGVSVR